MMVCFLIPMKHFFLLNTVSISLESRQFENIIFVVHTFFGATLSVAVKGLPWFALHWWGARTLRDLAFQAQIQLQCAGMEYKVQLCIHYHLIIQRVGFSKAFSSPKQNLCQVLLFPCNDIFIFLKIKFSSIVNLGIFLCHFSCDDLFENIGHYSFFPPISGS